ncbi:hypothetical protein [Allohahella sp. A8]|uniref:hypothetical protein n=1 Tax=Allohahella sp. A8 TaxID=3141461 RepID=UPI003A810741
MSGSGNETESENWAVRRLSHSPPESAGTSHAYYDIPVIDASGSQVVAHRLFFSGRQPNVEDRVEIGLLNIDAEASSDNWTPIGESRAWSWQQGPMTQWIGTTRQVVWNARRDATDQASPEIVAQIMDTVTGTSRQLPGQVYAVTPDGKTALSLDMTRLERLRPGYGYAARAGAVSLVRAPSDDGVWSMDMVSGERRLVLSLAEAVRFLQAHTPLKSRLKRALKRYHFWFNHAKFSPDRSRFTVKLRWRNIGGPWNDQQGVSLTCKLDGRDLRLLAQGTSHVIWLDDSHLYFWQRDGLRLAHDTSPKGSILEQLAPELIQANVHMRHFPDNNDQFIFDTPYREQIDLIVWNRRQNSHQTIATFTGHQPAKGPFRCDLHPSLSANGRQVVVTSLQSGKREVYVLELKST